MTKVIVILPEPKIGEEGVKLYHKGEHQYKTLWLLHGLSDDCTAWLRNSNIERFAEDHHLAVVMPEVNRSFYVNMTYGANYWDYLTNELYQRMNFYYPLSSATKDNIIAGISMGGYAALRYGGLFADRFCAIGAFSPVIKVREFKENKTFHMQDWDLVFDNQNLESGPLNVKWVINQLTDSQLNNLYLFTSSGKTDFTLAQNKEYKQFFDKKFSHYKFNIEDGGHEWSQWNKQIQVFLNWLAEEKLIH